MPDSDETMKRINRANAQAGGLAFLREDAIWEDIDALTDAFDHDFDHHLPYDNDPVAQRIAGHMVGDHVSRGDERSVVNQWCPSHDETKPETMARLYLLTYVNINFVVALENLGQVAEVAAKLRDSRCRARVARFCQADNGTQVLAVMRGEFVCLFSICRTCLQHIESGAGFNENYIGPDHDWIDTRKGAPKPKEFDLWGDDDDDVTGDGVPDYPNF